VGRDAQGGRRRWINNPLVRFLEYNVEGSVASGLFVIESARSPGEVKFVREAYRVAVHHVYARHLTGFCKTQCRVFSKFRFRDFAGREIPASSITGKTPKAVAAAI
jgi:hypothetical protein